MRTDSFHYKLSDVETTNGRYLLHFNLKFSNVSHESKIFDWNCRGLMIATSAVYFVETSEELFEEQDMIKGPFFLVVAIAYIPVAVWMLKSPNSSAPYLVTIAGTIGIIALYAVTRTDAGAIAFGLEHAGKIGHLGVVSKVVQVGVVIGSVWALMQTRREAWLEQEDVPNVRKQ